MPLTGFDFELFAIGYLLRKLYVVATWMIL
jgi:hypothetical protein